MPAAVSVLLLEFSSSPIATTRYTRDTEAAMMAAGSGKRR